MDERAAKDFMIIQMTKHSKIVSLFITGIWSMAIILLLSCSSDLSDDPIPPATFGDIVVNLNLPEYLVLRTEGGYKNIGAGVRGIILYRLNSTTCYAFERNCSYHPGDACATVEVHVSGLFMNDTCCGSTFDFNGNPTGGAAWRPLRRYYTELDGSVLTITDQVL
jgi:hypothetical protein